VARRGGAQARSWLEWGQFSGPKHFLLSPGAAGECGGWNGDAEQFGQKAPGISIFAIIGVSRQLRYFHRSGDAIIMMIASDFSVA